MPCCVADAIWRIGQVEVAGRVVGIANLSEIISEVRKLNLSRETEVREELLKRVKESNYVPRGMEEAYADAVFSKYREQQPGMDCGCGGR